MSTIPRLDASTVEIVNALQKAGYDVHFPIECDLGNYQAKVTLSGGRTALVSRNEQGGWVFEYDVPTAPPAESDNLTYYDMLNVSIALDHEYDRVTALWHDVVGKPAFKDKAREYADACNRTSALRQKVNRILQANRRQQRHDEEIEQARIARKAAIAAQEAAR